MGLFNGSMTQDHRERMVIDMLGHAPYDYESEVMHNVASELLRKAEAEADKWIRNEIAECLRGKRARSILKRRYEPV